MKMFFRLIMISLVMGFAPLSQAGSPGAASAAEDLGWRLGVQAWTFKNFTFFEAVDKAASMGLKYIEAYPGQPLSKDGDATLHHSMDVAPMQVVQEKLETAGVKLVNYGVVTGGDEAEWRRIFEFAKSLGIETITSEPGPDQMDLVEKLCEAFQINVAIHNHPKSPHSRYWNPEAVLEAVQGRSPRLGACADTGHWVRSGLDPVESLKKLEGRIISLHFKDLNINAPEAHDVPWGTGVSNVYAMLAELKRQDFRGVFSVEYEHNWDNSLPEIEKCIEYFGLMAAALDEKGYQPLFKADLSNAIHEKEPWIYRQGVLARGKGNIWTRERYGDFVLDLEFKLEPETNSGVFIRTRSIEEWLHTAIEVQILQPVGEDVKHNCGAIYDCLAPSKQRVKKPGEWNRYIIIAKDNQIFVIFNGEQVIDMDLDLWTEAHKNPDGTKNKFKYAYKDLSREGHIGLQDHGDPIWYRNLRIKPL